MKLNIVTFTDVPDCEGYLTFDSRPCKARNSWNRLTASSLDQDRFAFGTFDEVGVVGNNRGDRLTHVFLGDNQSSGTAAFSFPGIWVEIPQSDVPIVIGDLPDGNIRMEN